MLSKGGDNLNRIKDLRLEHSWSLRELSEKTGIPTATINRYERGVTEPKSEYWYRLAKAFDVSVPYVQGKSIFRHSASGEALHNIQASIRTDQLNKFNRLTYEMDKKYNNEVGNNTADVINQLIDLYNDSDTETSFAAENVKSLKNILDAIRPIIRMKQPTEANMYIYHQNLENINSELFNLYMRSTYQIDPEAPMDQNS